MTSITQIENLLSTLKGKIDECCTEAGRYADVLKEINTYDEILQDKNAQKKISEQVDIHSRICASLSNISVNLIRVRTLRKTISAADCLQSLTNKMLNRVDRLIKDLEDARSANSYLKDAFDARLRFFNACQYHI